VQTATSEEIEALKSNHDPANWIHTGMRLNHVGRSTFCDGIRVEQLNRHFDESLRQGQQTVDTLEAQIIKYEKQREQFVSYLEPPKAPDELRTKR
jgi:hypothetical protein